MDNKRNLTLTAFLALFVTAVALTITSASLPAMSKDFARPAADFGPLFFTFFFGFTAVVAVSGFISDFVGRKIVAVGIGFMAGGLLLFSTADSLLMMHIATLLFGAGCGITEGSATTLVADLNPENQGVWINLSQVFFAIGAIVAPIAVGLLNAQTENWRVSYIVAGALALFCFSLAMIQRYPKLVQPEEKINLSAVKKLFSSRTFVLICIAEAFYVGSEQGLASWLPTYFEEVLASQALVASASLSIFWGAMVFGRLAGSYALKFVTEEFLVRYCALGGFLVLGLGFVTRYPWLMMLGVFLAGLAYAPVWASILSSGVSKVTSLKGSAAGILIAAGSLGGMIYPALIGVMINLLGLRAAHALSLIPMLGVFLIFSSLKPQRVSEAAVGERTSS